MSSLRGLASIAKGLSAEPSAELVDELTPKVESVATSASNPGRNTPAKPLAKTRDQNYKRVMVLVRKATSRAAGGAPDTTRRAVLFQPLDPTSG